MKTMLLSAALLLAACVSSANAQYVVGPVTSYYAPGPVVTAGYAPAYYPRRAAYYAPVAPAAYYAPAAPAYSTYYAPAANPVYSSYYAPAAPAYSSYYAPAYAPYAAGYAPVVYGRPVVAGRSIYGTRQVYVPGRPVANTFRAITP